MNTYKVSIGIDSWKLPIFERRLSQAGFRVAYEVLGDGVHFLLVSTTNMDALTEVVVAAQAEAAQGKLSS